MFELIPFERSGNRVARNRKLNSMLDFDNIFENFFNDSMIPTVFRTNGEMKVDVKENDKEYILEAELPGLNKEDINIDILEDRLTISVKKDESMEEEKEGYIHRERRTSSMARSFKFANIESDKVNGKFENGLLILTIPKNEKNEPKSRKININ